MLIVRLEGGLGNQLFQVAFAHHVADVTGRRVAVDRSWFISGNVGQSRPFELLTGACGLRFVTLPRVAYGRAQRLVAPFRVVESDPSDDVLSRVGRSTMLVIGYFQSAAMVLAHAELVASIIDAHLIDEPVPEPFVAVHVRLGDYFSNPAARRVHGVTDPRWSIDEGRRLARSSGLGVVRVFTDDVAALHRQAGSCDDVVIDDAASSWEALGRMSRASALVMSNSTLSWWAGFTARHVHGKDVLVLCPTPWFASPSMFDDRIIVPGWTRVQRCLLSDD